MSTDTRSIAGELAEFAVRYDASDAARDAVSKSVVDVVGCILAATCEPVSRALRATFAGAGAVPVIGSADHAAPADAALILGTTAHALDLDDFDVRAGGHPAVAIIPAVFATAFYPDVDTSDLVAAIGAGYEAMTFLGLAMHKQAKSTGQHATGVTGAVGAAIAAGRVQRLDAPAMRDAIGNAVAQASGLRANFGTMAKPLQAGNAARAGVTAALLARHGVTGGRDAIGDPGGLVQLSVGAAARAEMRQRLLDSVPRLGSLLTELPPSLKRHASCGSTHASIDAALELREDIESLDDITGIEAAVPPVYLTSLFYSRPQTGLEAKFSLEHCIATALVHGDANRRRFLDDTFDDPRVMRTRELVTVRPDPQLEELRDAKKCLPARVQIRTSSDSRSVEIVDSVGTSRRPMDWSHVESKFADNAAALTEAQCKQICEILRRLQGPADIAEVAQLAAGVAAACP